MSFGGWKLSKAIVLLSVALAGCTTTQQANKVLETRFKGSPADSFFLAYGPPSSSYKLHSGGGTLYTWSERPKNYTMPMRANTTMYGNQAYTTFSGGGSYSVQCSLKIAVDAGGMIQTIDVLSDTMGDWELSRCHEVFGKKS